MIAHRKSVLKYPKMVPTPTEIAEARRTGIAGKTSALIPDLDNEGIE
jgi:hypothetical protein